MANRERLIKTLSVMILREGYIEKYLNYYLDHP
jgi:hypothetical protein